jgi:hypothetical protein
MAARVAEKLRVGRGQIRAVREQTGKSAAVQLAEIRALHRWQLGSREYYKYRLFDEERVRPEQRREYTGWRFERAVYGTVNDPGLLAPSGIAGSWNGMVDKLLFDVLMRAAGVPTPPLVAIFDPADAYYAGAASLRTAAELEWFMRDRAEAGFFAKPARAHGGTGAVSVERVEGDAAHLGDGSVRPIEELVQGLAAHRRVLVQERLVPHEGLRQAWGETLPTLRAVVLRGADRSEVHRMVIRIPVGQNMVDNFDFGRTGNLLGRVEAETGVLSRVYGGWGVEQRRVYEHPDSGATLEGLGLPDWHEARAMLEQASRLLVGMPFQSWDLALTDSGPVMIEVNDVSAQGILQLAGPPGLLDRQLCAFLREQNFRWPYPHPATTS